jgi:hypothetical protein
MSSLLDALWHSRDLVVIVGSQDRATGKEHGLLEERFHIEVTNAEVESSKIAGAVLTLIVRGLAAGGQHAVVEVNDRPVGVLCEYPGVEREHWFPEALSVGEDVLRAGENEIEVRAAGLPDPSAGGVSGSVQIRDLICHYQLQHQSV